MVEVTFTREAREDLLAIEAVLAQVNPTVAERFVDAVLQRCAELESFPELGPRRLDLRPDARCLTFERWLILYRAVPQGVEIVRVIDAVRDLTNLDWPGEHP